MARDTGKASTSTEATGTVKLDGDASGLERSMTRGAQKVAEFDTSLRRLEATSKQSNITAAAAAEAQRKAGAAMASVSSTHGPNLAKTFERIGFAAHQVVGQTTSFNGALQGVLGTLGPWGIAIGAAVGTLLHFANAQSEAAKKAREHNEELKKQAGLKREALQDQETDTKLALIRHANEKQEKREAKAREQIAINKREEKEALEEMVALTEARGKSAEGARRRQAELREETLREQAAVSGFEKQQELMREADAVAREEKLRRLEVEGRHEKELTENKKKQLTIAQELAKLNAEFMKRVAFGNSPSFGRTGQDTLFDIEAGGQRAANGMPGLSLAGGPAIMRDPNAAANAERQRNAALRVVELERAQEKEFDLQAELSRIDREKQAQFELLSFQEQVAANDSERLAVRERQRQAAHEAELARIAAEQTAQTKAAAKQAQTAEVVAGVIGSVTKIGALAAEASGKSAAKRARAAQIAGGIEALTIAGVETVKAAAAFASLNIPQGIAHTAAAALGFTQGALMLAGGTPSTGASAGRGGGAGAAGAGSVGSTESSGSNLPRGSDSQIPGSPGPRQRGGASAGGKTVVFTGPVHLYGTPHREFIRSIDEGLEDLSGSRRRRSA